MKQPLVTSAPRIGELGADISSFLVKFFAFFFLAAHSKSGYCKSARLGVASEGRHIPRESPERESRVSLSEDLHDS